MTTAHETAPVEAPGAHEESAGRHAIADVPRATESDTVGAAIDHLLARPHDCVDILCVVDAHGRLRGVVPLARLLAAPRDQALATVMDTDFARVHPGTDQERAASLALHHGISAMPVVDARGGLLGVVPASALLQVLRREHVEDLHRFAGITRETARAREAIEDPPLRRLRHRLP